MDECFITFSTGSRVSMSAGVTFDFYISTTGSDSNPGTLASPWAITSLLNPTNVNATANTSANRAAMTGKRVGLLPGTYSLSGLIDSTLVNSYHPILDIVAGSAVANTVIQATSARSAVLDGGNAASGGSDSYAPAIGQSTGGTGYITIDGLEIKNCNGGGINVYMNTGNANNCVFQNNHIHDIVTTVQGNNPGHIRGQFWLNCLIKNNYLHSYGTNAETNTAALAAILFYYGNGTIVTQNTINDVQAGVHAKGAGGGQDNHNTTVSYNWIEALLGQSQCIVDLSSNLGGTNYVHHNVCNGQLAINIGGYSTTKPDSATEYIYNNTMYFNGSDSGGGFSQCGTSVAGGLNYYNNIIQLTGATNGYVGEWTVITGTPNIHDYNCYCDGSTTSPSAMLAYGPLATWQSSPTKLTLASWQSTFSIDTHSISANGVLNTPTVGVKSSYQLGASSPCIGAGRVGGTPGGAICDMGAFDGTGTIGADFV